MQLLALFSSKLINSNYIFNLTIVVNADLLKFHFYHMNILSVLDPTIDIKPF